MGVELALRMELKEKSPALAELFFQSTVCNITVIPYTEQVFLKYTH
jgi:hypothetical protein